MRHLGLIGGSGLDQWGGSPDILRSGSVYGQPSAPIEEYRVDRVHVYFLPRHGPQHSIPPHAVNYRANIDSLVQAGVEGVIAVNAVGGITNHCQPGALIIPDQLIDYTWGREHSFSLSDADELQHVEFAAPFDGRLRTALIRAAERSGQEVTDGGCVAVSQGPRLETNAEIRRFRQDGCDMVGMTSMPEAVLAREAGLDYASLCVSANWAAGLGSTPVTMKAIETTLAEAMTRARTLIAILFEDLSHDF